MGCRVERVLFPRVEGPPRVEQGIASSDLPKKIQTLEVLFCEYLVLIAWRSYTKWDRLKSPPTIRNSLGVGNKRANTLVKKLI